MFVLCFMYSCDTTDTGKGSLAKEKSGVSSCSKGEAPPVVVWGKDEIERVPCELYNAFNRYWDYRENFDWNSIYDMEAPHVRWATDLIRFKKIFALASKLLNVNVVQVEKVTNEIYDIHVKSRMISVRTGNEMEVWTDEKWIKVDGKWFHVWKSPFLQFN